MKRFKPNKLYFSLWRTVLVVISFFVLSACGLFADGPATQALQRIETFVTMPAAGYLEQRKRLALREQGSIDYLRARIEQDATLSFEIEDMRRPDAKQREVIVSVSEKRGARGSQELARYRAQVKQNEKGVWMVISFQLVE